MARRSVGRGRDRLYPGRSRQESGRRGNPMTRTWTIIASNLHLRLFMASSSDPPESPK